MSKYPTIKYPRGIVGALATVCLASASAAQGSLLDFTRSNAVLAPPSESRSGGCSPLLDQLPNQVNGFFADADCDFCAGVQSMAADIVLTQQVSICDLVIWGGYFPTNIPMTTDDFTVVIHDDAGGVPGAVVYSEPAVFSSKVPTGTVLFGVDEYEHTLTLGTAVSIGPGTYHLEIFNNTAGSTESWFWETGALDGTYGVSGNSWAVETPGVTWNRDSGNDLAVQLRTQSGPTVFCVSGLGDAIPTGGVNTGNSAGWDSLNVDHDFTMTDAPGFSTVVVPTAVTNITSVEIEGLTHSWMGDTQCVLTDPNGVGYNIWLRPEIEVGETCCGNSGDFLGGTYRFVEPGTSANGPLPQSGDAAPGDWDQSWQSWDAVNNLVWPDGDENVFNVPLSGISGPAGVWTINIYDWATGDPGSFTGWTLCGNGPGPVGPGTQYCSGDGSWEPCPCGNDNDGSMSGCDWMNAGGGAAGGFLAAVGSDSMAANDTFLMAENISGDFGVFFSANAQVTGFALGDGIRCAGHGLIRMTPPIAPGGSTATHGVALQMLDPMAAPGITRYYQYWFRTSPGACGSLANTTNGYFIDWKN